MQDGTFVMTANGMEALMKLSGYWVAYEETTLDEITIGDTIGIWNDPITNKLWIDKSMHVNDLGTALFLGRMYNQKAIYDIVNKQEIRLAA